MKKLTSIILFALLLCIANLSFAQETTLTKKQMYKDFDQLVKIIEDCNVQLPIRKAVTGYDNFAAIKSFRKNIDTVTCNDGFNRILSKALTYVMDDHSVPTYDYYAGYENLDGIDTAYLRDKQEQSFKKIMSTDNQNRLNDMYFPIPVSCYQGNYYMIGDNQYISKKDNKDTLKISFMKMLAYNGQEFHKYAKENNFATFWDYRKKEFYLSGLWLPKSGILKVEQNDSVFEINLNDYITNWRWCNSIESVKIEGVPVDERNYPFNNRKEVKYFEKDSILYIYLQSMMVDDTSFYDKIKEVGKGKIIKKVVIDVRSNSGGSDLVWHNTLKAIIKDSIPFNLRVAYNNTKIMREKLKEHNSDVITEKISWLGNKKYRIITDNDYLVGDSNSLKYDGKIYILYNEGTFSSAHSFVTYADYLDKLVSIGYPTGRLVGFGLMASLFQLEYSKFTFRLACTMDVTNCKKPIDVYHDFPEIEVNPTLEEGILYPSSFYDTKSKEFLYKYDPMFKKVIELK